MGISVRQIVEREDGRHFAQVAYHTPRGSGLVWIELHDELPPAEGQDGEHSTEEER